MRGTIQDIQALKDVGVSISNLERPFVSEKFRTTAAAPPLAATLEIELSTVWIKYEYIFLQKDSQVDRRTGTLRIDSDSDGAVRVYKNGDTYSDESAVSKLLLKPLLEHITSQAVTF